MVGYQTINKGTKELKRKTINQENLGCRNMEIKNIGNN